MLNVSLRQIPSVYSITQELLQKLVIAMSAQQAPLILLYYV